jgi:hypothetical protein
MIKFCSECGVKVEYKFSPPKFCSHCGVSMGNVGIGPTARIEKGVEKTSKKIEAVSDSETDANHVPRISKLEYEIDNFGRNYDMTIGSLAGKTAPKPRHIRRRNIDEV